VDAASIADDIAKLMTAFRAGDSQAARELVDLLYPELRRMAASQMRREPAGHSWQPTALVNEFYLELIKIRALQPGDSAGEEKQAFLRLAAHVMKRLLIHHSRPLYRRVGKVALEEIPDLAGRGDQELTEITTALGRLETIHPRLRAVVELKVFEGLTGEEIAQRLGCGPATVARDWSFARKWLQEEMQP
jgi:RNA polymerase sigma factor (TIGR02999 family)